MVYNYNTSVSVCGAAGIADTLHKFTSAQLSIGLMIQHRGCMKWWWFNTVHMVHVYNGLQRCMLYVYCVHNTGTIDCSLLFMYVFVIFKSLFKSFVSQSKHDVQLSLFAANESCIVYHYR